jgi:hypothetical protein
MTGKTEKTSSKRENAFARAREVKRKLKLQLLEAQKKIQELENKLKEKA